MSAITSVDPIEDFYSKLANPLSSELLGGIDSEKVVRLFSLFSRFEHALKCGGFAKSNNRMGHIEPDWEHFCTHMAGAFNNSDSQRLNVSVQYLMNNPPKKQKLDHSWEDVQDPTWCTDASSKAIWRAKNVRNNLFHGGKYRHVSKERDERLIDAACDIVLASLMDKTPLRQCFETPPQTAP
ncbi:hypothetical protein IBZ12_10480 [Serratia ureilytica]|uniref:hypothetical protein n=1 Tax=Serratia ureilytica TaxID=300181 RepID=UPI0039B448E9